MNFLSEVCLEKNIIIVPMRFFGKVAASIYCPEDKVYWVDSQGHAHHFEYLGRCFTDEEISCT